jgi:hypothetical protein
MKRIALLAVIAGSLMALPSTATAQNGAASCLGTTVGTVTVGIPASGVCIYESTSWAGGELVINNADSCTYINAWSSNPGTPGYAGLCTESASRGPSCTADPADADPANTGGCFGITPAPAAGNQVLNSGPASAVTAMFICDDGNPQNAGRDGCLIP